MTPIAKLVLFWLASALMFLFACYCALAILQAGSIYTGDRAQFNLYYWGSRMGGALVAALVFVILALRTGRSGRQQ